MFSIALINSLIFFSLSVLHFYWLFGGTWGMDSVIPTNKKSTDKLFKPSHLSIIVVAIGLLVFAIIEIGNTDIFSNKLKLKYFQWGNLFIAFIFTIRAVGDFSHVGFFKRVRDSSFAKNDTRYYSPLCLYIATTSLLIVFAS
ncbi:MAG: DUF3995 domain-containing protein [Bacteroidota bacterium]|mgnify:CR=1 FL=1